MAQPETTPQYEAQPGERQPVKWASITPKPGDDGKRAPKSGDYHICTPNDDNYLSYSKYGWVDYPHCYCVYCRHCGGFLPTQDKHEGGAEQKTHEYIDKARVRVARSIADSWGKLSKGEREALANEVDKEWGPETEYPFIGVDQAAACDSKTVYSCGATGLGNSTPEAIAKWDTDSAVWTSLDDALAQRQREDAEIKKALESIPANLSGLRVLMEEEKDSAMRVFLRRDEGTPSLVYLAGPSGYVPPGIADAIYTRTGAEFLKLLGAE